MTDKEFETRLQAIAEMVRKQKYGPHTPQSDARMALVLIETLALLLVERNTVDPAPLPLLPPSIPKPGDKVKRRPDGKWELAPDGVATHEIIDVAPGLDRGLIYELPHTIATDHRTGEVEHLPPRLKMIDPVHYAAAARHATVCDELAEGVRVLNELAARAARVSR